MQGNILWAKNGFENAEAAYLRAVDLDRTYVSALTNVEKLCGQFDDDKWAQEEDNCSRLTDDADLGTGGEGTQGLCAVYAAERSIHLLIEKKPSNPKTYNSLGNILRAKGDLLTSWSDRCLPQRYIFGCKLCICFHEFGQRS